jgi:hypothetical protein
LNFSVKYDILIYRINTHYYNYVYGGIIMKKRIASLALALLLSCGSISAFAVTGFSDLNEFHAWAEPQIEEMTTLGIIKGYTDGTFRPDQAITKTEALVLAARVAGYISYNNDTFTTAAYERYQTLVNTYQTPYPYEVSYLLYKGILSEQEISGYISPERSTSPLLRYEMAELLTKIMRAEDNLLLPSDVTLSYSDAGEIPYDSFPYVNYVSEQSLMQGVYDPEYPSDVFFKPYSPVTRAQMAVLLYRVLDKVDISVSYTTALGKNTSNNTLTLRSDDKTSIMQIPDDVNLLIDGYISDSVDPVSSGASVALFSINGTLRDIEIVNDFYHKYNGSQITTPTQTQTNPVSGTIEQISLSGDCTITVNGVTYVVSSAATVFVSSVVSTIYDLRVGQSVNLEFSAGKVIKINADSSQGTSAVSCEGTVTKVFPSNRALYLKVTSSETGEVNERLLNLESGCVIVNAITGIAMSLSDINSGATISASGTLKDGSFYASKIVVR